MKSEINLSWKEGMAFETEVNGHKLFLDAAESGGGKDLGPRPKALVMVALAGCTGMDVVSILEKMRVNLDNFDDKVSGEITDEHPKQFTSMHITYEFWGKDLEPEKLQKAIDLSTEKYCGVSATLKKSIPITHSILIHSL